MKGVLFTPEMIQAVVEGRKTHTRRVIKPQPKRINDDFDGTWEWKEEGHYYDDLTLVSMLEENAPCQPGEVIYIKEDVCIQYYEGGGEEESCYREEFYEIRSTRPSGNCKRLSAQHMPAWAARYFLRVLNVRAQRLQEMTDKDAIHEGIDADFYEYPRLAFSELWDSLNPKYPFDSNPWVWDYELAMELG